MYRERVEEAFAQNAWILETSRLGELKIDSWGIRRLLENGTMERIRTGYCRSLAVDIGEVAMIARLLPEAPLWLSAALFYHGYNNQTPMEWDLVVSKNVSPSRFRVDYPYVRPFFVRPEVLSYGVKPIVVHGVSMNTVDKDRLICECLKYEAGMDSETFSKAIQAYVDDPLKSIRNLQDYAKRRRVTRRVHDVLGGWL